MTARFREIISKDVQDLIKKITGFEENQENFRTCERFIMSNLLHHRFMSVDGHAIRRSMDGMVLKFQVHGLLDRAEELDSQVEKFLVCCDFKDHDTVDIQWCLLSLLLHLAQSPTNKLDALENEPQFPLSLSTDEPNFDWIAYLKEEQEDFKQSWSDDTSDDDEVDCMVFMGNEDRPSQPSQTVDSKSPAVSTSPKPLAPSDVLNSKAEVNPQKLNFLNAQNVLAAERWLCNNVQHNWWSKPFYKEKLLSNNPYSQTACLRDPAQIQGIKTSTLSEHKISLEIIWLLSAPCDSTVFMRIISEDGRKTHFSVRPHVTSPSLTQDVFTSFISSICNYADMVEELQTFCSEICKSSVPEKVCGTYEAYRCALLHELKLFYEALSVLEQCAHKQEDTLTLLMLMSELSPWLSTVASLYKLHSIAVLDWRQHSNWQCATHLLAVILSSLRSSDNDVQKYFRIFVRTFQVYINIIDQWLMGGHLIDPWDEFFITRKDKINGGPEATFEKRDWETIVTAHGVEPPKALQVLANRLLKAAEPLHVLCEMKRLSELRKCSASRCSLESLFLQHLIHDLESSESLHSTSVETVKERNQAGTDVWWKQLDSDLISEAQAEGSIISTQESVDYSKVVDVKAIMSHLHRLEEPLLMKDFHSLFCNTNKMHEVVGNNKETNPYLDRLLLLSNSMSDHLPLESCVERAVLRLSADWDSIAGTLVAVILIRERQLLSHLCTAQSVFMLQVSHKLHPFVTNLFKMILHQKDSLNSSSHSLSVLLQDCLDSDQFLVSLSFENCDPSEMHTLDLLDTISLKYQVEWPLCTILGEKSQCSYNIILRLLLKLRWGLWIVEKLSLTDIKTRDNTGEAQRLLHLRFWLLRVLGGSYSFLAGHILNALWIKFEDNVRSAKDMHSIIQAHDKFLDCILKRSLHAGKPDPIKNALFQLVVLAENLYSSWNAPSSEALLRKLSNIETCYVECHLFLAAALHSLAEEEGLQDLEVLSDLFNSTLPKRRMDP